MREKTDAEKAEHYETCFVAQSTCLQVTHAKLGELRRQLRELEAETWARTIEREP